MAPLLRRGIGDGTCQVPMPGVAMVYPPCPSIAPLTYQDRGGAAASYVAPTAVPRPACSYDPNPFVANSAACIAQLLAAQQGNFQVDNDANRAVFVQDCLNTVPQPPDCLTRTYGQTPAGGYTSDAIVQGGQLILDARGNVVSAVDPATGEVPVVNAPPAPAATPPAQTPAATPPAKNAAGGSNAAPPPSTVVPGVPDSLIYWSIGIALVGIVITVVKS